MVETEFSGNRGNSDEAVSSDLVNALLESVSPAGAQRLQTDPGFATPSDAFTLFIEMVREYLPPDKQQRLVQARSCGDTLESALSVDFVFSLAMAEFRERFHLPSEGSQPPL
jgi:hypothetical protein